MNTSFVCFSLAVVLTFGATGRAAQLRWNADALVLRIEELSKLPPLAEGVSELKFADLYKLPVGPRGLELTEKVRSLDGRRVRVLGFMVRQAKSAPGLLMLAPYELSTNEVEFGTSDDLPPSLIFVEVPKYEDLSVPFTPGPLLLTGTLEVGRREEADGRFSEVRLKLDESLSPKPASADPLPPAAGGSNITTASPSKS
jgi:hypothetical protein